MTPAWEKKEWSEGKGAWQWVWGVFNAKESVCLCKWVNCQAQQPLGTCMSLLLFVSAVYDSAHTQTHTQIRSHTSFLEESVTCIGYCLVTVVPAQMSLFPPCCVEAYVSNCGKNIESEFVRLWEYEKWREHFQYKSLVCVCRCMGCSPVCRITHTSR